MGRPKALLPWRGRTLIEHVVSVLGSVVDEVIVVGSAELELPSLEARVVTDREPRLGPLGGLRDGLEAASAELLYATSTDAPFLSAAFVEKVLSYGTAAAPHVDGYVQPLAAAYPRALAEMAGTLIREQRMRPLFLLEAGDFRRIAPDELPDLDSLRNLNTPDAYLEALRDAGEQGPVTVELLGLARQKTKTETLAVDMGTLAQVLDSVEERFPQLELLSNGTPGSHFLF